MIEVLKKILKIERLNKIKIPKEFENHPPKLLKMQYRLNYYKETKKFLVPIVIKENLLIDGYTSYLIAKKYHKKYVKVVRK